MSAYYDEIADSYDQSMQLLPLRKYVEAYSVLRALGELRGKSVIDLACGTGFYSRACKRAGATPVVGIDLSGEMLRAAQEIEKTTQLGIDYRQGDVSKLPELGAFDVVLGVYLLHYASSPESLAGMCQGIAASLKPGGRFVSFVLNPDIASDPNYYQSYGLVHHCEGPRRDGQPIAASVHIGELVLPGLTVYRWERATLAQALQQAGLSDVAFALPQASPQGIESLGEAFFQAYLQTPHCLLIEARKA
jgi:2-polyprenyl-3-methyl-5-hydroxy-6-metoxy-1,4-benzoquinol methylase